MIYPNNFEQKIGFNEVRTLLKGKCLSALGTTKVDDMTMSHNADEIQTWLTQTREFRLLQTQADDFPLQYFFDLRPTLSRLRIEGTHLDEQELFDLLRSLDTIHQVVRFLNRTTEGQVAIEGQNARFPYPSLQLLTIDVATFPDIVRHITQIVDKFGKIKDSASPELARIRRELAQTEAYPQLHPPQCSTRGIGRERRYACHTRGATCDTRFAWNETQNRRYRPR